jgi:hypothetical protein
MSTRTLRNVAIVLVIAGVIDVIPQGGQAANTFSAVLSLVFAGAILLMVGRAYQGGRVTIDSLGERDRPMLYAALAVAAVTLTATTRMFNTAAGEFAWFVLMAAVVYALYVVFRHWRAS